MCLEHYVFTFVKSLVEVTACVGNVRNKRRTVFFKPCKHLFNGKRFASVCAAQDKIFPFHNCFKARLQVLGMQQIAHTYCFFHVFVGVHGAYSAARRTKLSVSKTILFKAVLRHVERTANHRFVADKQVFRGNFDACVVQTLYFTAKVLQIYYHTVAHHVYLVGAQNARRQKIEHETSLVVYYRVSGVVAALIANDYVLIFRQKVDHTSFTFVTPVDTDNTCKHIFPPRKQFNANLTIRGGVKRAPAPLPSKSLCFVSAIYPRRRQSRQPDVRRCR